VQQNPSATPAEVAAIRSSELRESCQRLGIRPPRLLEHTDGAVDKDALVPDIKAAADDFRPDLVVTLGPDGAYGHRDHIAVTEAVEEVFGGEVPIYEAVFPVGLFAPVWRVMKQQFPTVMGELAEDDLGTDVRQADVVLDTSLLAYKRTEALTAHQSQLPGGNPSRFLGKNFIDKLLSREYYRVV
jgi:LmbE family N-acetylglucosaminyl deacetylase